MHFLRTGCQQNAGAFTGCCTGGEDVIQQQDPLAYECLRFCSLVHAQHIGLSVSTPQTVNEFKWKDLSTEGGTNLSAAYDELSKWLCKKEKGGQMPDIGGVAPILILMTDGMPTSFDWEQHLDSLKKKGWFKVALKYALAIGIDTQEAMDVLSKFTGNPETVLKVYTAEALRKVIKVIAVTASKVKSNSASMGFGGTMGATNNEVAKNEIAEKLEDIQDVEW